MIGNTFEWLLGSVEVSAAAPEDWKNRHILPFWQDPNNEAWGRHISRYVMHETIHFWQLLSSGYLLRRLTSEWTVFSTYRTTGRVTDLDRKDEPPLQTCADGDPFSPFELMECWARFWDIHTRSPAVIIEDEGHQGPPDRPLIVVDPITGKTSYTQFAFDWLMQNGPDQSAYIRPYQWVLNFLDGNSRAAIASFPIIVHAAFSTQEPVRFFCNAMATVNQSQNFRDFIALQVPEYNLINRLWFYVWKPVVTEVLRCSRELQIPIAWGIDQLGFQMLPVYQKYPWRFEEMIGVLKQEPKAHLLPARKEELEFASVTRYGVFALPGIPLIRRILGNYLPPPRIRFANFDWYADEAVPSSLASMEEAMGGQTTRELVESLDDEVGAFREAQWMRQECLRVG